MTQIYLGQIMMAGFGLVPRGTAACNGATMAINQSSALFSLLGTYYGGDGIRTFNLPNMQGNVPLGFNGTYPIGSHAGEANHTLIIGEMPMHNHVLAASTTAAAGGRVTPSGGYFGAQSSSPTIPIYGSVPAAANTITLANQTLTQAGNTQPHPNMQPYLAINFVIATSGIFPSRG